MKLVTIYDPTERPFAERLKIAYAILRGNVHTFLQYCVGWHYEGRMLPPKEIRVWAKRVYPNFQVHLTEPKTNGKPAIELHKTVSYFYLKQQATKKKRKRV